MMKLSEMLYLMGYYIGTLEFLCRNINNPNILETIQDMNKLLVQIKDMVKE